MQNLILKTDSYKLSHSRQYPPGTKTIYSYFEARGGKSPATVFFGLQAILKEHLMGRVITPHSIAEANDLATLHFGDSTHFNVEGWRHIWRDHSGRLPLRIKAVAEGTPVPLRNVLMTVENTCPQCYWLTNYLETLLVQTWYPTTVATLSRDFKQDILMYLDRTGDPTLVDFKLHDFGFRGVSSVESAGLGGLAHLVNFKGTDTLAALVAARRCYHEPCAGFSIPAAEHSTITSWGRDGECDAYRNMLTQYPTGLVAFPIDSYDTLHAVDTHLGVTLKDVILARNGTVVARPDSGYPPKVVCTLLDILYRRLGGKENSKGFKVLDSHIRVIQGDGIDREMGNEVMHKMQHEGWSMDNVAFGSGGGLLQKMNRDTHAFAFKCSAIEGLAGWQDVYKAPSTDTAKMSKRGRLALVKDETRGYTTVPEFSGLASDGEYGANQLVTVFEDGNLLQDWTLEEVREHAMLPMSVSV